MDKKILLLGIAGAVAGFFIISRLGNESSDSGATGGGSPTSEPKKEYYSMEPKYDIDFPENPFPVFDFSLPDPYGYTGGSAASKKYSKQTYENVIHDPGFVGPTVREMDLGATPYTMTEKLSIIKDPIMSVEDKMTILQSPTNFKSKKGG